MPPAVQAGTNGIWIAPDKRGGLNGSVQHLLAVYLLEFQIPMFFSDADLSAAPPRRAQLVNALTNLFVLGSTDATGHSCFRSSRAATGFGDRRSKLSLPYPS